MRRLLAVLCLSVLLPLPARPAEPDADLPARTVVLVNRDQPESVTLGEFYLEQRGIPRANLIALPMPAEETITWHRFVDEVWQPLQDELYRRGWLQGVAGEKLDRFGRRRTAFVSHTLAYLVVCRGTPLRVENDPTLVNQHQLPKWAEIYRTTQCSVDSELSLLAVGNHDISEFVPNPLFQRDNHLPAGSDLVIKVSRLDGPSDEAARHLVTAAITAERQGLTGRFYVDLMPQGAPSPQGDVWLDAARKDAEALGFDGDTDRNPGTFDAAARFDAPALYFGWYAGQANGPFLREGFTFPPGAIAEHIHSFSAATLRSDRDGWCGPLVARGVTATVGNVFEPYLGTLHRPDLLLHALVQGRTLGDAAYYALPALSWQCVLIGDPLYRPFRLGVEEQRRRLSELPADLAPYAVIREARLLDLAGKHDEAAAVRLAGLRRYGGLPLELAHTEAALAYGRPARPEELALKAGVLDPARAADWPLVRAAARLLGRAGATGPALQLYRRLADAAAPEPAARTALLAEAAQAAKAAGDKAAEQEFERLAQPPSQPAVKPPARQD